MFDLQMELEPWVKCGRSETGGPGEKIWTQEKNNKKVCILTCAEELNRSR